MKKPSLTLIIMFPSLRFAHRNGKFRAPSLRNVGPAAPHIHDGSIETLEELTDFYASGSRNIKASKYQGDGCSNPNRSDLVSDFFINPEEPQAGIDFLHCLTDQSFIYNSVFSDPFGS